MMQTWQRIVLIGLLGAALLGTAEAQQQKGKGTPKVQTPPGKSAQPAKEQSMAERVQRKEAPIVIDADRMEAVKRESLVIFTGNVVAKQDTSTQQADKMEVYLDEKGERVVRIISIGNVKIVTEDCRTGTSRRSEYYDDDQKIVLIGNAKVWEEENVIEGDVITIWLNEDRSVVEGSKQSRVKAIFYPKKEEKAEGKPRTTAKKGGC